MVEPSPLSPLEAAIAALVESLRAQRVRGMLIGAVAASLLGRPRTTRDVDAVVWLERPREWARFLAGLRTHGIEPRIAAPLDFAARSRVLLLRHAPSGIDVDISLGALPFEEEAISRATERKVGRLRVPLPTPEDLVIMKAIAHRPRDAADIEGLLDAHPDLDATRVRRWVGEFAEALDAPELLTDLESLLERRPERKRTRAARATALARGSAAPAKKTPANKTPAKRRGRR